ncbi:MAG: CinA family protein [Bacteroidaceae bacterium]|nr:CinA family protein [Bacteroidaceae bacterium]
MDAVALLSQKVNDALRARSLTLATAESCTGGSIAAAITSMSGSSDIFKGGVVAYSNEIKERLLGVAHETLENYGAVSEPVVREMALGAKSAIRCDCAVATSGIAGPSGGTPEKPVGTVWVAVAVGETVYTKLLQLVDNGRLANINATVEKVLELLLEKLKK